MLNLGIIGTSWISASFIEAALETKRYALKAVYSRSIGKGLSFTEDYDDVDVYDDMAEFLDSKLDVVYIASPNALHYPQAKAVIEAGKHVIVEKPAFSNPKELEDIQRLAVEHNVYAIEAARNLHEPAFEDIKNFLDTKEVIGANFSYAKYSSKMPALLDGELPNKFNPAMSGGLLADLGVYLLYTAIGWFGKPRSATYKAILTDEHGVDLSGTGVLRYENFDVSIHTAGNYNSYLPSEIYTTDGTLILDGVNAIKYASFTKLDGTSEDLKLRASASKNLLFDEALAFSKLLTNPKATASGDCYEDLAMIAYAVAQTSFEMRESAGITFAADKN
jgi:predicted dehydrogenase